MDFQDQSRITCLGTAMITTSLGLSSEKEDSDRSSNANFLCMSY